MGLCEFCTWTRDGPKVDAVGQETRINFQPCDNRDRRDAVRPEQAELV